ATVVTPADPSLYTQSATIAVQFNGDQSVEGSILGISGQHTISVRWDEVTGVTGSDAANQTAPWTIEATIHPDMEKPGDKVQLTPVEMYPFQGKTELHFGYEPQAPSVLVGVSPGYIRNYTVSGNMASRTFTVQGEWLSDAKISYSKTTFNATLSTPYSYQVLNPYGAHYEIEPAFLSAKLNGTTVADISLTNITNAWDMNLAYRNGTKDEGFSVDGQINAHQLEPYLVSIKTRPDNTNLTRFIDVKNVELFPDPSSPTYYNPTGGTNTAVFHVSEKSLSTFNVTAGAIRDWTVDFKGDVSGKISGRYLQVIEFQPSNETEGRPLLLNWVTPSTSIYGGDNATVNVDIEDLLAPSWIKVKSITRPLTTRMHVEPIPKCSTAPDTTGSPGAPVPPSLPKFDATLNFTATEGNPSWTFSVSKACQTPDAAASTSLTVDTGDGTWLDDYEIHYENATTKASVEGSNLRKIVFISGDALNVSYEAPYTDGATVARGPAKLRLHVENLYHGAWEDLINANADHLNRFTISAKDITKELQVLNINVDCGYHPGLDLWLRKVLKTNVTIANVTLLHGVPYNDSPNVPGYHLFNFDFDKTQGGSLPYYIGVSPYLGWPNYGEYYPEDTLFPQHVTHSGPGQTVPVLLVFSTSADHYRTTSVC
ncbi:MAG: hypothetical protein LC620_02970, partial [Halobacteriales archaeon]|nr:hypothetical protein [Halobacteriales archaeon]